MKEKLLNNSVYRKIETRMWGDEKFCSLSPMKPSGQALWIYLLTGPHSTRIPGLFRAGEAALAEDLGWPLEAFREAFREVLGEGFQEGFSKDLQEGMARSCRKAKVIWIKNAIFCNKPASPNVVISWKYDWDLIPECDLKCEAYDFLESAMEAIGESFLDAFRKACRKPLRKPFGKAFGKPFGKPSSNQEQEQEQYQKQQSQILLSNFDKKIEIERDTIAEGRLSKQEDIDRHLPRETVGFEIGVPKIEGKAHNFGNGSNTVQSSKNEPSETIFELLEPSSEPKKNLNSNFNKFWKAYPRKQKKKQSLDIWKRKKLNTLIDIILEDLEQRTDWKKGSVFTPLPSSYLNGERWEDEEKNERRTERIDKNEPKKSIAEIMIEKYNQKEKQ